MLIGRPSWTTEEQPPLFKCTVCADISFWFAPDFDSVRSFVRSCPAVIRFRVKLLTESRREGGEKKDTSVPCEIKPYIYDWGASCAPVREPSSTGGGGYWKRDETAFLAAYINRARLDKTAGEFSRAVKIFFLPPPSEKREFNHLWNIEFFPARHFHSHDEYFIARSGFSTRSFFSRSTTRSSIQFASRILKIFSSQSFPLSYLREEGEK